MDDEMVDNVENSTDSPRVEPVPDDEAQTMEGVVATSEDEPLCVENQVVSSSNDPSSGYYTWAIKDFRNRREHKIFSDSFEVGDQQWNILLFPKGTKPTDVRCLSLFLNVPDAEQQPINWGRKAYFKLTVINQKQPSRSVSKETEHSFSQREVDWGFTQFVALDELEPEEKGFIVDNTLKIRADVRVERQNGLAYNSKEETGYVGLKNQGATCYMNSLLQTLYSINYFRQAVYHMPTTEEEVPQKSIPLALQSLFYKLQFTNVSASTKDLTKSFGWDNHEAFMQHDVQELNRVLCENLEEKMKGTKVEGTINQLFEGHTHNFIECINVDYKSTRRESYMDLQLDVKGCKDVYESFDRYCEVELLNGSNQYKAEEHGLQDAKKGVLFDDFPPVLQLQLKRFEYDFNRDSMMKVNSRYEFYDELDLDVGDGKYLSKNADRSVRNKYRLHGVLVHSGGVHGGHYYAFIRPDGETWLKFDDEKVTKEDRKKALDEQFGGEDEMPTSGFPAANFKLTKYSNAYMLVYIRESDWPKVMCEVKAEDIAEHVRARLEKEHAEKERKRLDKAEAHKFTFLRIATDNDLQEQIGKDRYFDLVDHEKVNVYKARKGKDFGSYKEDIANTFNVAPDQMRLWYWNKRTNQTYRPARPLRPDEESLKVEEMHEHIHNISYHNKGATPHNVNFFLEVPVPPATALPALTERAQYFLFAKFYDPEKEALSYAGRLFLPPTTTLPELEAALRRLKGLEDGTELEVYEEVKVEPTLMIEQFPADSDLGSNQIEDGDVFIFQERVKPEDEQKYQHPHVPGFMQYVRNKQPVTFKSLKNAKEEGLSLVLSKANTYDDVAEKLAEQLNLDDPQRLRFTQHNVYTQGPKPQPLRFQQMDTLSDMLSQYNSFADVLYYEILDMKLPELEKLKILKVEAHGERPGSNVQVKTLRLPREGTVDDVLQQLANDQETGFENKKLRLMEILFNKIYKVFEGSDRIESINDQYWTLRAEPVPEDQLEYTDKDRLLQVCHIAPLNPNQSLVNFGDPFLFRIEENETLSQIKERIRGKLPKEVTDEDYAKYKFYIVHPLRAPQPLSDTDVVASHMPKTAFASSEGPYLGMEHVDNLPRRAAVNPARSAYERPVKIYS